MTSVEKRCKCTRRVRLQMLGFSDDIISKVFSNIKH